MTFLNPFALVGLAAAAIPIILHLLNLRKLKTVEFSSLQFLRELQKSKIRRVKIRQLLLLLLRTLLIIALVLAFSRPALRGTQAGTLGAHAKTTMVMLLDDSPSMAVRDERGVLFTQAKAAAGHLLDLVKEDDEVHLLRLSEMRRLAAAPEEAQGPHQHQSAEELKIALARMEVSPSTETMRDAFGGAAKILSLSRNYNQEVYLITDAQATQFSADTVAQDSSILFKPRVRIYLIQIARQQIGNSGIAATAVTSRIVTTMKPVTIEATVWNHSQTPLQNSLLNLYLDGSRVFQQSTTIPPTASRLYSLSAIPKRRGILKGYLQLEDDPLEIDNTRYFVLTVPEGINVLLTGLRPTDTRFPGLALTLQGDTSLARLFTVRQTGASEFSALDLNKFDVLILCNVPRISSSEAERIAQFVEAGNGLLIFPGDSTSVSDYNNVLFHRLGIPPAQQATGTTAAGGGQSFISFGKVDYAHPLFSGLFDQTGIGPKKAPAVESPQVYRSIAPGQTERSQAIITLSDGKGFLTEYLAGTGRVLLFSVEAGFSWSDFPVKGLFAPLIHRATIYLGAHNNQASSFIVGEPLRFFVRPRTGSDRAAYVLRSPSGTDERILPRFSAASGIAMFESERSTEVGTYELRQAQSPGSTKQSGKTDLVAAAAVNVDPAESDLRQVSVDELAAFWSRIGVRPEQARQIAAGETLDAAVLEARFGVELWKYFVGIAVMLALLEMAIGREPKSTSEQ